jgi:hypothetical protein
VIVGCRYALAQKQQREIKQDRIQLANINIQKINPFRRIIIQLIFSHGTFDLLQGLPFHKDVEHYF